MSHSRFENIWYLVILSRILAEVAETELLIICLGYDRRTCPQLRSTGVSAA